MPVWENNQPRNSCSRGDTQKLAGIEQLAPPEDSLCLRSPCTQGSSHSPCETRASPAVKVEQPDASQGKHYAVPATTGDASVWPASHIQSEDTDCKLPVFAAASTQGPKVIQQCSTNDQSCEAGLFLVGAEQRKQHRRTANCESARKTRERRLHTCSRLEAEVPLCFTSWLCLLFGACYTHLLIGHQSSAVVAGTLS